MLSALWASLLEADTHGLTSRIKKERSRGEQLRPRQEGDTKLTVVVGRAEGKDARSVISVSVGKQR